MSGSVTRLCHDGPVKQGVLCRYGVRGTVLSENLRLIAFSEQAIKGSSKCLQEINHLRQTYHSDLPQYTIQHEPKPHKRKQKQSRSVMLSPKRQKVDEKRKTGKLVACIDTHIHVHVYTHVYTCTLMQAHMSCIHCMLM